MIVYLDKNDLINYINSELYHLPIINSKNNHNTECESNIDSNNLELIPNNHIVKKIIEANMFKKFNFHKEQLLKYNINMTDNQLKYNLELIRNNNFEKDNTYLNNLFNYKVDISSNNSENNLKPFCISYIKYYN